MYSVIHTPTPELDALIGEGSWVRDAAGCLVPREELAWRVGTELLEESESELSRLIDQIRNDKRKTFSKARIIKMIEEYL